MNSFRKVSNLVLSLILFLSLTLSFTSPNVVFAESVITINSASELEQVRNNPSGNFELAADIVLTGEFTPIPKFNGTLDGNGYKIYGLKIAASESQPKAAFIVNNEGTIEQIAFVNVNITGLSTDSTYWAGGIVARNTGTIRESYVTGSITGGYRSAGIAVTNYGQIQDVYTEAFISAKVESGGLVAVSESGSSIRSSYSIPDIYSEQNNTSSISGYAYTGAVIENNAVLAGTIDNGGASNIGRIAGRLNTAPTLINNLASENVMVRGVAATGGALNNYHGLSVTDAALELETTYKNDLGWDFDTTWEMSTELKRPILLFANVAEPVDITTAADLELIRNNPWADYKLSADIELTDNFVPLPTFNGTLNGDGHLINGMTIVADANRPKVGFIIENSGTITDIGLTNIAIVGKTTDTNYWAGGITAENRGTIKESFVTGMIVGSYRSGGIAAHNYSVIKDVFTDATVKARGESGGLVAVSEAGSTLSTSYVVPNVYSLRNNTGGLTGYAYTDAVIKNNIIAAGSINNDGGSNIARIAGRLNGSPIFSNNMASENALVQGNIVTGGVGNNNQGLTVTDSKINNESTYREQLAWNFDDIWKMNSATGLPYLQAFEELSEDEADSIVYRIFRNELVELSKGVEHRQMDFVDANGNIQKSNIIDTDITLPQNKIIVGVKNNQIPPTDANGNYVRTEDNEGHDILKGSVEVQAGTTNIPGKKVVAGVNGEFYTKDGPEGYMIKDGSSIINGVRISGIDGKQYPFHGFFGIRRDGSAIIGNYDEDWDTVKDDLVQASGGQYQIVKDGVEQNFNGMVISDPNNPNYDDQTYYRHADRHPRTAAGIRSDGTVLFVVVDGRGANDSTGLYIEELGSYMKELGAYQAINMDGGGSSTAVTLNGNTNEYLTRNTPINKVNGINTPGVPRDVFSSLLVLVDQP